MKLLVVEDEALLRHHLYTRLGEQGHVVDAVANAEEALYRAAEYHHDLAMIDLGLPGMSGLDLIREFRSQGKSFPILILTARGNWQDKVEGLAAGADDYVVKPFSPREVAARVKAILKRTAPREALAQAPVGNGPFEVDEERFQIRYHGQSLALTRHEFRLLQTLLARPERVFSREQLLDALGVAADAGYERNVDSHIKSLRAKLRQVAPAAEPIQTHRGLGYSYAPDKS